MVARSPMTKIPRFYTLKPNEKPRSYPSEKGYNWATSSRNVKIENESKYQIIPKTEISRVCHSGIPHRI